MRARFQELPTKHEHAMLEKSPMQHIEHIARDGLVQVDAFHQAADRTGQGSNLDAHKNLLLIDIFDLDTFMPPSARSFRHADRAAYTRAPRRFRRSRRCGRSEAGCGPLRETAAGRARTPGCIRAVPAPCACGTSRQSASGA